MGGRATRPGPLLPGIVLVLIAACAVVSENLRVPEALAETLWRLWPWAIVAAGAVLVVRARRGAPDLRPAPRRRPQPRSRIFGTGFRARRTVDPSRPLAGSAGWDSSRAVMTSSASAEAISRVKKPVDRRW